MTAPAPNTSSGSLLRRRRGMVTVLAIVVVVAVVAVLVFVAERRADSAAVDATTAAPIATPAMPPVLGDKRFRVTVADQPDAKPQVLAAGPGFAVLIDNTLTSFGADGSERWHYRPTDTAITDAHVYDDGEVLIAATADRSADPERLVAFDANTGRQLWNSKRDDLRGAFAGYQNPDEGDQPPFPTSRFLAQSAGTVMVGFDPRTGEDSWRQSRGCANTAYTPAQLVCLNVFGDHIRAAVVDSATGTQTAEWRAPIPGAGRPETWAFLNSSVVASGAGVAMTFWFSTRTREKIPSQVVYLNTITGASRPLGDNVSEVIGGDPRGDLLVRTLRDDRTTTVALVDPNGVQRCVLAPGAAPGHCEDGSLTAWLPDQIISLVHSRATPNPEESFAVFDRECRTPAALPPLADTGIIGIVPAPGATLLVRNDDDGTHVDGYAPR